MGNESTAGAPPELDAAYWEAVSSAGHFRHESGHAVMAALCDFRVVKIVLPRAIIDTNEHSSFGSSSGPLSDDGKAWMQTFDRARALPKGRRLAMIALSGLYSQFKDCRGHPNIPRAMRSAGKYDIRYASCHLRKIALEEGCSYALVRRQAKARTQQILQMECVWRVVNEVAAAYGHRLNNGVELSGEEFYATIKKIICH